jgi:hypothetical protein
MIDAPVPISPKAAWTVRKTAVTLVRKTSSKSFSRVSSIGLNFAISALANRMPRWPNSFLIRSKRL